ncbi:hypothetical protein KP509_07G079300 [Ceratopteris richardii]|uniref:Uncharacterized protein n=1 Tax=Ceratopteris richardii TaxID=49495 RepID=A0A8T2UGM9_CERRI|nr:hypothetical protein KP509_07G079300 [Ceratopteris richardii]
MASLWTNKAPFVLLGSDLGCSTILSSCPLLVVGCPQEHCCCHMAELWGPASRLYGLWLSRGVPTTLPLGLLVGATDLAAGRDFLLGGLDLKPSLGVQFFGALLLAQS